MERARIKEEALIAVISGHDPRNVGSIKRIEASGSVAPSAAEIEIPMAEISAP